MVTGQPSNKKKVNSCSFATSNEGIKDVDVVFPMSAVRVVAERFTCTIYGYFLGTRIAFSIVQNYVMNVWKKYGLVKTMMNSKGFYFLSLSLTKECWTFLKMVLGWCLIPLFS